MTPRLVPVSNAVQLSKAVQRAPSQTSTAPAGDVPVTVVAKDKAAEQESAEAGTVTSGIDLDDLARRLLDPVGRLLRTELRHGRERAGRLHDRRR